MSIMQSFIGTNLTISGDGGGGPPPGPTAYPPTLSLNYGSMNFTGIDYLETTTDPQDFAVGTGDYTVEWWQWMLSDSSNVGRLFSIGSWPTCALGMSIEGGGSIFYLWAEGGGGGNNMVGSLTPDVNDVLNTWLHVAISRVSGTTKIFLNGVEAFSTGNSYNVTNSGNLGLTLGNQSDHSAPFKGYIKDFRFIKGVGVYTSAFTPPRQPLTVTAETVLLFSVNSESGLIVDSSTHTHNVGTSGVYWAQVSPYDLALEVDASNISSYDPNTPSAWLDLSGNGNHITLTDTTNPSPGIINFGSTGHGQSMGAFNDQNNVTPRLSISLWATVRANGSYQHIAGFRGGNFFHILLLNNDANLECRVSDNGGYWDVLPTVNDRTGQMTHYAFVANGDRIDAYVNGVARGGTVGIGGMFNGQLGTFNLGQVVGGFQSNNLDVSYVRVDNRARSPREIYQEWDRTRASHGM